ncbi:MAG: protein kinase, partial [Planctomycetota bacterium]
MRPTFSEALDFVIVREIARGAMGTVYEALQCGIEGFAKRVAIKVLNAEMSALRSVFAAEAHLVANLVHQNIVQTYHLGEVDGALFFAMEL